MVRGWRKHLMLNANGQTYDTLSQFAETIDLDGIPRKQ
jgi:hypothetical protein